MEFDGRPKRAVKTVERQHGRVERLVTGRLVYVAFTPEDKPKAFKLNRLLIKQSNGTFSSYTGEPFSQLGLGVGSSVMAVRAPGGQANLVFDPSEKGSRASVFAGGLKSIFRRG